MSKHCHIHLLFKLSLLITAWAVVLSGCNLGASNVPRLRIINNGSVPIKNLVVLFPQTRIEFGDVPAATTTKYKEAPTGVFRYAAYQFEVDGQVVTEPAIDWIGENPMSGNSFTYIIDYDPNRTNTASRIQLIEVKNDD